MRIGNTITAKMIGRRAGRVLAALALACMLALPLADCGKRGDPVHPDRDGPKFPKTYPDPKTYPPS